MQADLSLRMSLAVALLVGTACGGGSKPAGGDGAAGADGGAAGASGRDASDATTEGAACACFEHGRWAIDNLSPCFLFMDAAQSMVAAAVSTVENGTLTMCPTDPTMAPSQPWSTDKLTIDCAGHYRLCYTLKAGDAKNPLPTDCMVAQSCAEGDDTSPSAAQAWPPLPSWITTPTQLACAQSFYDHGGYGEMTATGTPSGCSEPITTTFGRVSYCPQACNGLAPPASCATCQAGGGGAF
jgi:hypothetical protein